jgi:nucleosome-remodeling factor subunit BPTF
VKEGGDNRKSLLSAKILKKKSQWISEIYDINGSAECDSDSRISLDESTNSTTDYLENEGIPVDPCIDQTLPDIDEPLEELILPPSCDDLMIVNDYVLPSIAIYEVLRRFYRPLRLTPFRVEDFCAALSLPDSSRLLDEVHLLLLRSAIRSDEGIGTMFTSVDSKDSAAILLFFGTSDPVTWFELCRLYLNCLPSSVTLQNVLEIFHHRSVYADVTVDERLAILQVLVDLFLSTESARDYLTSFNTEILHENHCRNCNK